MDRATQTVIEHIRDNTVENWDGEITLFYEQYISGQISFSSIEELYEVTQALKFLAYAANFMGQLVHEVVAGTVENIELQSAEYVRKFTES